MENVNPTEAGGTPRKSRRWLLVVLFLLFAAPLIAAWVLYLNINRWHFGSTSHGEFIQPPRQLALPTLSLPIAGGTLAADYFKGRWTLVYVGPSHCDPDCSGALYNTRQVRYAMGKKIEAVQRLYLVDGKPADAERLTRLQPDLTVADVSGRAGQQLVDRFSDNGSEPPAMGGYIYLVDPHGFYVMRYATHADPKGLLKDLQRLLGGGGGM
ncbi:MAG TPA: hypothetical protein VFM15_05665 [Gammaproteobacteria bacterium]|nr:hypothetical protein [Gammaproteobacteria bacterium]